MRDRAWRVIYLLVVSGAALGSAVATEAELALTEESGRWLEILLITAVSAFLFEPFFSGSGPAVANSLLATLTALSLGFDQSGLLVGALLAVGVVNLVILTVAYVLKDAGAPRETTVNRVARVLEHIGRSVGGWRFLLVVALAVTLIVNNPPFADPWRISTVVLLLMLAITKHAPHELVRALRGDVEPQRERLEAARIFPPQELVITGDDVSRLQPGDLVTLISPPESRPGLVVGHSLLEGRRAARVLAPDVTVLSASGHLDEINVSTSSPPPQDGRVQEALEELSIKGHEVFGITGEGSSINELKVELPVDKTVSVGDLVWTVKEGVRLFWQVADASVQRVAWAGDTHRSTIASAHQVGKWIPDKSAFEVDTGSPTPSDLIYGGTVTSSEVADLTPGQVEIGSIPGASFPIRLDLRELSLHHAAVLGITGTGKTHLSFALARALADHGTKVICVDTTGQYSKRFRDEAVEEIEWATTKAFLDSDKTLAIYRPDPDKNTITEGNELSKNLFKWAKSGPELEEGDSARLVILFEEAQNFVPETFVIDDWGLKATSQETSRVIMESRKFGLGFILVSQRTAMVTKSALSQCNTVFAFQAFDQTGLDYLEGICGAPLARGIPSLPRQTAVVMGRGLTSSRPLIVRVSDAEVVVV